jgi:hypothetical protein
VLRNGDVLVTGGIGVKLRQTDEDPISASCMIYNVKTQEYRETGDMTIPRKFHAGCLLEDGNVFVCGGASIGQYAVEGVIQKWSGPTASCELYNVSTGVWSKLPKMTESRIGSSCVLLPDGRVLIIGGGFFGKCDMYDPHANAISLAASIPLHLMGFATVALYT